VPASDSERQMADGDKSQPGTGGGDAGSSRVAMSAATDANNELRTVVERGGGGSEDAEDEHGGEEPVSKGHGSSAANGDKGSDLC